MKPPPHAILLVMFWMNVIFYPRNVMQYECPYDGERHFSYYNPVNVYIYALTHQISVKEVFFIIGKRRCKMDLGTQITCFGYHADTPNEDFTIACTYKIQLSTNVFILIPNMHVHVSLARALITRWYIITSIIILLS